MLRASNASYALRELTARKGRSIATIGGLSIGIALYVALTALSNAYTVLIHQPFSQLNVDVTIQRSLASQSRPLTNGIRLPFSNQPILGDDVDRMRQIPGIENLSPSVLLWDQSPKGFVVISGIDLTSPSIGPGKVMGWVVKGRHLSGKGPEVLLEKHFATFHGKKPNDIIRLGGKDFRIVGTVERKDGGTISSANAYIAIDQARDLADLQSKSSNMLFARLKKGTDPDTVRPALEGIIPGTVVSTADNITAMSKGFSKISGGFSSMMGILSLVFAGIVAYRVLCGSINERMAEIGVMKAVGWKKRDIILTLTFESLLLGIAGGLMGILLGYLGAYALSAVKISLAMPWNLSPVPAGSGQMSNMNVHAFSLPIALSYRTMAVSLTAAAAISALSGALAARKPARIKVMEAMRSV